jgi:hypothetical protein
VLDAVAFTVIFLARPKYIDIGKLRWDCTTGLIPDQLVVQRHMHVCCACVAHACVLCTQGFAGWRMANTKKLLPVPFGGRLLLRWMELLHWTCIREVGVNWLETRNGDARASIAACRIRNYLGSHDWVNRNSFNIHIIVLGLLCLVINIAAILFALGLVIVVMQASGHCLRHYTCTGLGRESMTLQKGHYGASFSLYTYPYVHVCSPHMHDVAASTGRLANAV